MNNERLKQLRREHHHTQAYVAKYLGLTRSAYEHYETGRCSIPLDAAIRLAKLYQIRVDDLIEDPE